MAGSYLVERSTLVEARAERVYEQIADFRRWTAWSPWEDLDPGLRRTYSGAERGTGAVYAWSGNRKAGAGRMEIVDASEPRRVDIDLVFEKPWRARNHTRFVLTHDGGCTRVTWLMTGRATLATRVMGVFGGVDKLVGRDFEKGLTRLKRVVEAPRT